MNASYVVVADRKIRLHRVQFILLASVVCLICLEEGCHLVVDKKGHVIIPNKNRLSCNMESLDEFVGCTVELSNFLAAFSPLVVLKDIEVA